ncbi:MAG: winged helix-turn-helix domain-containing protein [Candidatus Eremiobacteraeota bacterium]|nr:winged helix-turn-helix domain-containing protein [Candidatus Eremiobacteraeota bacterium]
MIYAFGPFELDTRERCVTREGRRLYLSPQSYRLLLYLVERGSRLVPSTELISALWEGAGDGTHRLRQEMSMLRHRLGLQSREDLILTVPPYGYRLAVLPTLRQRRGSARLVHADALRCFVDGMGQMAQQNADSLIAAYRSFEAATQIDSSFAAAYLAMARVQLTLGCNFFAEMSSTIPSVERLIAEALRCDPGFIEAELLRWEVALAAGTDVSTIIARLRELAGSNPNVAAVRHALGWAKLLALDSAGALDETLKAAACDPSDLQLHCAVAAASFYHGNFAQMLAELELIVRREPWRVASRGSLATALIFLDRHADAMEILGAPDLKAHQSAQAAHCWVLARTGHVDSSRSVLEELLSAPREFVSDYCVARCHLALGDSEAALMALDRASGELQLKLLALDPWFRTLRSNADFWRIVRKHRPAMRDLSA